MTLASAFSVTFRQVFFGAFTRQPSHQAGGPKQSFGVTRVLPKMGLIQYTPPSLDMDPWNPKYRFSGTSYQTSVYIYLQFVFSSDYALFQSMPIPIGSMGQFYYMYPHVFFHKGCLVGSMFGGINGSGKYTRWWFQIFFIFNPTWGNDPIWLICFKGVETTN